MSLDYDRFTLVLNHGERIQTDHNSFFCPIKLQPEYGSNVPWTMSDVPGRSLLSRGYGLRVHRSKKSRYFRHCRQSGTSPNSSKTHLLRFAKTFFKPYLTRWHDQYRLYNRVLWGDWWVKEAFCLGVMKVKIRKMSAYFTFAYDRFVIGGGREESQTREQNIHFVKAIEIISWDEW